MSSTIFCTKCFTLRFLPTEVCEQAVEEECCEDSALTEPPWQPLTSDPVKSKSRDCLLWLVDLQRADGSWILNSELCSCLNVSESAVHSALPKTCECRIAPVFFWKCVVCPKLDIPINTPFFIHTALMIVLYRSFNWRVFNLSIYVVP